MSFLGPERVIWLQNAVAEYINGERERFAGQCVPLLEQDHRLMAAHFPAEDLARVRVREIEERVANPVFYPELRALGFANLPDFALMAAITFDDAVVSHEPFTPRLLFHELVHVVQYRLLRVEAFARLYVQGFLTGGSYEAIPLEICAYALEGQFVKGAHRINVDQEVRHWIDTARF